MAQKGKKKQNARVKPARAKAAKVKVAARLTKKAGSGKASSKPSSKLRPPAVAKKVAQAKLRMTKEASTQDLAKAAAKLKSAPETTRDLPGVGAVVAKPPRAARPAPRLCHESGCEAEPVVGDYCRVHYIRNWRKIKRKEVILKERKLNQYVEELVNKYPEKYIEAIQQDLANDKDFSKVVHDLELNLAIEDEEGESEAIDSLLDNIRKDIDVGSNSPGVPGDEDEDLF